MIKIVYEPLGDLPKKCPDSWRRSVFPWRRRKSLYVIRQRIRLLEFELEFFDVPEPGGLPPATSTYLEQSANSSPL